jgi:60 kDa SS-A/Ro ribonucleoprotein
MSYALEHRLNVDCFVICTDNETWCSNCEPVDVLRKYRNEINPKAKLAVLAFSSTEFSIADPDDVGMLDVAGMDATVPDVLRNFVLS